MDLQGQPIPPGQRSTKVTSDPERRNNPIQEPSGPITNDSLAAESATQGGAFSQNRGAQPMGVSAGQSTVRTTDTSAATKLDSNADTQDRYPEGLGGQGNYPGAHVSESGYVGGPTAAQKELGIGQGQYPASQKLSQQQQSSGGGGSGAAPSYVHDVTGRLGDSKPKGANLKEGDIPDDAPNASYTTDIGSENDPGRLAQGGFQRKTAESGPAGTNAGRQKGVDNQHPYQVLQSDQRA
ncbi:transketolase [Aspergillus niger]|uniref:Transketolase n=1 Tax=Aspergillus niger TaxID=5061 RepID=A0A505HXG5_ASPNG|nr:transketolase [Aspergillus niger]